MVLHRPVESTRPIRSWHAEFPRAALLTRITSSYCARQTASYNWVKASKQNYSERHTGRKPKMTVTSRFIDEQRPLASRNIPSPFPNPPPNREAIGRLNFRGPSPKMDLIVEYFTQAISGASLENAIVFLDTNIFTRELDQSIWDALFARQSYITPGVNREMLPWLKTPFCNKAIRDRVVAALKHQVNCGREGQEPPPFPEIPAWGIPKVEVLFLGDDFKAHGYEYYAKLLALRKVMGTVATNILTRKLGRSPTDDEFVGEVQNHLGRRGLFIAKKGQNAANSPNKFADEELVVMAALTAILKGRETFIISRAPDVLEQYFKVLCLMKEHYRAMLVADKYAANPEAMPFREVPIKNDGNEPQRFSGSSFLQFESTDLEFNPLPAKFHFVNVYCFLLGGELPKMKATYCCFCAETEMAEMLRVKTATGGLSTDKLGGRNCTIHTVPLSPETCKVVVSIGMDTIRPPGKADGFRLDDFLNAVCENELHTHLSYAPNLTGQ